MAVGVEVLVGVGVWVAVAVAVAVLVGVGVGNLMAGSLAKPYPQVSFGRPLPCCWA